MADGAGLTLQARLAAAWPSRRLALFGPPAWAAAMAVSAAVGLLGRGWAPGSHLAGVAALFAAGGALAFLPAAIAAGLVRRRRGEADVAAAALALAGLTLAATGLLNGLLYRDYYATWHAAFGTRLWANQFVFTVAAGIYQFLVLGSRLFLPVGLPALVIAALLIARPGLTPGKKTG